MKSIGNGWKRAQRAKQKADDKASENERRIEAQREHERNDAMFARAYLAAISRGKPQTLWQRIKRAFLRSKK